MKLQQRVERRGRGESLATRQGWQPERGGRVEGMSKRKARAVASIRTPALPDLARPLSHVNRWSETRSSRRIPPVHVEYMDSLVVNDRLVSPSPCFLSSCIETYKERMNIIVDKRKSTME